VAALAGASVSDVPKARFELARPWVSVTLRVVAVHRHDQCARPAEVPNGTDPTSVDAWYVEAAGIDPAAFVKIIARHRSTQRGAPRQDRMVHYGSGDGPVMMMPRSSPFTRGSKTTIAVDPA